MYSLPDNLPVPVDDGACKHLPGTRVPSVALLSTEGNMVDLSKLEGYTVIYAYPRTGRSDESDSAEWDALPGARGCTPQSCGFRDNYEEFRSLGVRVVGLSTQSSDYQCEAVERLHLPFALLSDASLELTTALALPTFTFEPYPGQSPIHLRRLTIVLHDGIIEHIFYPVFPPDRSAHDTLAWLRTSF